MILGGFISIGSGLAVPFGVSPMSFEKLYATLANLPVASAADEIVDSVLSGVVTVLASETGSGKTLYASTRLAERLRMQGECVVVLEPRRFLAVNAAETVAELAGLNVGGPVGYAVGSQSGDRSNRSDDTSLLFVTTGYALASGLVHTATAFILDEVHETTMDLSIVRALIRRRMEQGEQIRVLEMSATIDARKQADYWSPLAQTKVFHVDGSVFPCELRHRPAGNVAEQVIALAQEGRRGILVFRPGVGEVKETAEEIEMLALAAGLEIDVALIYGEMDYMERRDATKAPEPGVIKVLVGTNVVESGVNLPWLDAGVSCGTGKENNVRPETGATYLDLIELPRWRLDQQMGRVRRFCPGLFVLCSHLSYEERELMTNPEIIRLALTELVMHCSGFGLRTHDLTFDYAPNAAKVFEAEQKLRQLGLIDEDCQLTNAGAFVTDLPVGPETGAMLWHALQTRCLPQAIALAALIEVGGLRKDYRNPHYLEGTSDILDGLLAFNKVDGATGKTRRALMEQHNVSYKRYQAMCDLGSDLQRRLDTEASFDFELVMGALRRCILAGSLTHLFIGAFDKVIPVGGYVPYRIGNGSAVRFADDGTIVAGSLRLIQPKDKFKIPFTIVEHVTVGSVEDLKMIAVVRPDILVESMEGSTYGSPYKVTKLFGQHALPEPRPHYDDWSTDSDPYRYSAGRRW